MLRIGALTVAGVNIEEEASELFALGLLHCFTFIQLVSTNGNLPLFVSYAQIAIAKVPTTIRINPASAFLLNFSLNTK